VRAGPVFSPDGQWIAFSQNNDFKKVSIQGGPPIMLCRQCTNGFRGASWASDGSIVFAPAGGTVGFRRVSANGGEPAPIGGVDPNETASVLFPEVLPGADKVLYTATKGGLDTARIMVRDLKTGAQTVLIEGGSQPHFVPGGFLIYAVDGAVRAVRFDPARMTVSGTPVAVLDHVVMKSTGAADFFVSANGTLVYLAGESRSGSTSIAWIARNGATESLAIPPHTFAIARLSPDDRRIAIDTRDADPDVWIWEFDRRVLSRLTLNPAPDMYPVWSPDGQRIFFSSTRSGPRNVFVQRSDGTGGVEQLTKAGRSVIPTAITPDGKTLIVTKDLDGGNSDLAALSLEADYRETALTHSPFIETNADISPDGHWIAYESNESGRTEIYVHPFPDFNSGRWQVSSGGGSRPLWARSGHELFYQTLDLHLVAVPLQPGGGFNWGTAVPVIKERVFVAGPGRSYDVSADGRRVLAVTTAGTPGNRPSAPPQMNVALNWIEDMKSKAR
jgi:dipeptidyl aminopeptidase/acylaminoacyl peptidase